jgi:hypothetical protein
MLNFNRGKKKQTDAKTAVTAKITSETLTPADPDDQAAGGSCYSDGTENKEGAGR